MTVVSTTRQSKLDGKEPVKRFLIESGRSKLPQVPASLSMSETFFLYALYMGVGGRLVDSKIFVRLIDCMSETARHG